MRRREWEITVREVGKRMGLGGGVVIENSPLIVRIYCVYTFIKECRAYDMSVSNITVENG